MLICHDGIAQRLAEHSRTVLNTPLPKAAVLLLLVEKNHSLHLVLTHRARHLKLHAGEIAFPGGKQDPEDTTLLATVLRESHEEINLNPDNIKILGQCSDIISLTGIQVTPFVGIMDENTSLSPNKMEIEQIFTVPVSFFSRLSCKKLRINKPGLEIIAPCFQYGEYKIWGLTAFILVEFLNLTHDAGLTEFKPLVCPPPVNQDSQTIFT